MDCSLYLDLFLSICRKTGEDLLVWIRGLAITAVVALHTLVTHRARVPLGHGQWVYLAHFEVV